MKKNAIIIDLDGTLANCDHRRHFVECAEKDWKTFLSDEQVLKDKPNKWCVSIMDAFKFKAFVIIVTGRMEQSGPATRKWLKKHKVHYEMMFMRQNQDYREDRIVKEEILLNKLDKYNILFAIDDRTSVALVWRKHKIPTLFCGELRFGDLDIGD